MNQCHGFMARVGATRRPSQTDLLVQQLAQPQLPGERSRLNQSGEGDGMVVIELGNQALPGQRC
jgi:hypothetical protein